MSDDDNKDSEKLAEATREVLANLTANETKVLRKKFVIDISSEHTLEEIYTQFDVVRERIQQIEEKALKKTRPKKRTRSLTQMFLLQIAQRSS